MKPKRYKRTRAKGKLTYKHRHVWELVNGPIPEGMQIDHINGDTHDNSIDNLRLVDTQENMRNAKVYSTNKSGVTGISWQPSRNKWLATIKIDGKTVSLGRYAEWFDAVCARMSANNRYGFHENHGRR